MTAKKPVVVYGVSGYTGRLVCEYLRELNVPFIAAGRDKARVQQVIDKVPGIDTVEHEVVEVAHEVGALTELLSGAKVVSNMVGPFIKYGPEVVEAALAAGCHYVDTTGEQDWVLQAQSGWGDKFAGHGLLLSPGVAQMYTTGEIAANICLETPGLDTLDILVLSKGFPTYPSMQTIFTILKANWYYLEQNQYKQWDPRTTFEVTIPGQHVTGLALPWGGTCHPVWFKDDPRVANCKGRRRRLRPHSHGGRRRNRETRRGADQDSSGRPTGGGACRGGQLSAGGHAAAGESARQHLSGLGVRLGSAGPGALCDPRQLQLQADRATAGLHRVLPIAAATEAGRVRLRVPGLRPPRTARHLAELRVGDGTDSDRTHVTAGSSHAPD